MASLFRPTNPVNKLVTRVIGNVIKPFQSWRNILHGVENHLGLRHGDLLFFTFL
jgi:hypothetical protein